MGHGMVAASCVILIDLVIQIVSSFPRPVPVPGLVGVSKSAQRLTNGEFRLLWVGAVRLLQTHTSTYCRQATRFSRSTWSKTPVL